MNKIMKFFSTNVGSFVLTFAVIFSLFSLKEQFGIEDDLVTTIVVAVIAISVSEGTRRFSKKALEIQEENRKKEVIDEIEAQRKENNKAK